MMKIICDMGESFGHWKMGNDESIMPYIDIACIACGFHAGDPDTLAATIQLAKKHNVSIGAHPSYPDKIGFGRRSIQHTPKQLEHLIAYQLGALKAIAQHYQAHVEYIKPHGALYHDTYSNDALFEALLNVVVKQENKLRLIGHFSHSQQAMAKHYQVTLANEVYADRAYQNNGQLVPRSNANAVYNDSSDIIKQLTSLFDSGIVTTLDNKKIQLNADLVCIHGDNPATLAAISHWRNEISS